MIEGLPIWISLLFIITAITALLIFYYSNGKPNKLIVGLIIWTIFQSILGYNGFYQDTDPFPPRFLLVLVPTVLLILYGLTKKPLHWILENRNNKISTFLHTIRIPIEIVLLYLFLGQQIPELMTFEGRNFDIIAGITAPIIGFLWLEDKIGSKALLAWNIIALGLVLFIFGNGILSSELPIQQFGFDQPNRAVTYFPFILLPGLVVPIVIYTHITDIIKLMREQ